MVNTSNGKSRAQADKDADARTKRRAAHAQIVAGLQSILEADEQLLGFTRGLIAGGLRGKLTVGFEALFAPCVNIGLTERRVVLQHVQPESGKPNEILPHSFPLSELQSIAFSDIETFGAEPAGRLNLRLFNDQHFRLRFREAEFVENARLIAEVFSSLTASRPKARTSPTQSVCPHCDQILDRVSRFCPYCGQVLDSLQPAAPVSADAGTETVEAPGNAESAPMNGEPAEPQPASATERETAGSEADGANRTLPSDWKAGDEPQVETVTTEATAEPSTEGHESPEHGADQHTIESEGDRTE